MAVLSINEINQKLEEVNGWNYENEKINKEFRFSNFKDALTFVNKVGNVAEEINHHPDILIHSYNKVKLTVSTHDENGITEKDFKLASKVNSVS